MWLYQYTVLSGQDPDNTGNLPPIMILGNKNDLEDQRVISKAEGEEFTRKQGDSIIFMETSAKMNTNIDKVRDPLMSLKVTSVFRYLRTWSVKLKKTRPKLLLLGKEKERKPAACCCKRRQLLVVIHPNAVCRSDRSNYNDLSQCTSPHY